MTQRILVIEDNKNIQKLLHLNFRKANFEVIQAFDGLEGISAVKKEIPDLIILDINLPMVNGVEVCRRLKGNPETKHIPIIMLTVKKDEIDRILGFELGVDDYVTKPFSPRELILRVKAVLGRKEELGTKPVLEAGNIVLDESAFEVRVSGKLVSLTFTEFKLLKYFLVNRERVLSRSVLLNNVWEYGADIDTRTVDAHVKSLRKKLKFKDLKIETVIGMGYKLTANV